MSTDEEVDRKSDETHMKKPHPGITIPDICHENWKDMTPTAKGAFCQRCVKEVKDFSRSTDEEIIHTLKNAAGKVCGRFRRDQIVHPVKDTKLIDLLPFKAGQVAKVAAAVVACFFTTDAMQAQKGEIRMGKFMVQEQPESLSQTTIYGTVKDGDGHLIKGAEILVLQTTGEAPSTYSDVHGRFELIVKRTDTMSTFIDLSVAAPGLMSRMYTRFILDKDIILLEVKMDASYFLMGDTMLVEPQHLDSDTLGNRLQSSAIETGDIGGQEGVIGDPMCATDIP